MPAPATKNVTGFVLGVSADVLDGASLLFDLDPQYVTVGDDGIVVGEQAADVKGVSVPVGSDGSFTVPIVAVDNPTWDINVSLVGPNVETPVAFKMVPPPASGTGDVTVVPLIRDPDSGVPPIAVTTLVGLTDVEGVDAATAGEPLVKLVDGNWGPGSVTGAVSSVNGHTGVVNLGPTDIGSPASGDVVLKANNLSDLANAGTARTNLGLGTAATQSSSDFDAAGAAAAVAVTVTGLTSAVGQLKGAVVYVEDHGAVGDGVTDDTAAIKAAITAAVSAATTSGSNYAEIRFQAKTYLVNGSLTTGGTGSYNSILPLPLVVSTAAKITICFKGAGNASAYSHWNQTVPQQAGSVIRTTLTGLSTSGGTDPSIIGGPGPSYNGGNGFNDFFSNLLVVVDGIQLQAPQNPSMVGFDFRQCASAHVISASCIANVPVVGSSPNLTTQPTNSNGLGLAMPTVTNNDISQVESFTCEGFYYGLSASEHFNAQRIGFLYVNTGLYLRASGVAVHGASILYMGCESFKHAIWCDSTSSGTPQFPINVGLLDCEAMLSGGDHVNDSGVGGALIGTVHWAAYDQTGPIVNGGSQLRVVNERQAHGAVTAPSVPTTTTPLQNPFWRDAVVYPAGTTFTAIKVDGVSVGTTGPVFVPTGKTIELDYSTGTPTWVWTLL